MKSISIPYKAAEKEGLIGKVFLIWINEVAILDETTRDIISREWENGTIELIIPKEKLNE
jgi:hypothetical protein